MATSDPECIIFPRTVIAISLSSRDENSCKMSMQLLKILTCSLHGLWREYGAEDGAITLERSFHANGLLIIGPIV